MLKSRVRTAYILSMLLPGCAVTPDGRLAGAGSASYEYRRTLADGSSCTVSVLSGRDVIGGELQIDPDCGVTSRVDSTRGVVDALEVVNSSIHAVREAVSKVP